MPKNFPGRVWLKWMAKTKSSRTSRHAPNLPREKGRCYDCCSCFNCAASVTRVHNHLIARREAKARVSTWTTSTLEARKYMAVYGEDARLGADVKRPRPSDGARSHLGALLLLSVRVDPLASDSAGKAGKPPAQNRPDALGRPLLPPPLAPPPA